MTSLPETRDGQEDSELPQPPLESLTFLGTALDGEYEPTPEQHALWRETVEWSLAIVLTLMVLAFIALTPDACWRS